MSNVLEVWRITALGVLGVFGVFAIVFLAVYLAIRAGLWLAEYLS